MKIKDWETAPAADEREVDLVESGLLWLINRQVFHPRGFALSRDPDTNTFYLNGDGADVWSYAEDIGENAKLRRVEALFARQRGGW